MTTALVESPLALDDASAFAHDVRDGLSRTPKSLSSAYFYDDRGSRLFQQITEQPEYYLTRCERDILRTHASDLARASRHEPCQVIEIGPGDGHKTDFVLEPLVAAGLLHEYVPIDICREAVVSLTTRLKQRLDGRPIRVRGIVADYFDAFPLLKCGGPARKLVLFLGSSIGNFDSRAARRLVREVRRWLVPGDLVLIGFDLKKDLSILLPAYDDAAGVTREFNFNLLNRINRELGGRFDRARFHHHATYNLRLGCMESWLVSRQRQCVPIAALKTSISLEAWEGIRVERLYKYDLDQIESLAEAARCQVRAHYFDRRRYFVDSLWEAV